MPRRDGRPAATTSPSDAATGQRSRRARPTLPSSRALVGGVLVVAAAAGVLATHRSATGAPRDRVLVVTDAIDAGTTLGEEHLGTVAMDVPDGLVVMDETEVDQVLGRVTRAPLDELALLRASDLLEPDRFVGPGDVELALDLPPAQAMSGALSTGERVDVLATDPEGSGTSTIVRAALVTQVARHGDESSIGASGTVRVRLAVADTRVAEAVVDSSLRGEVTLVLPSPAPASEPT